MRKKEMLGVITVSAFFLIALLLVWNVDIQSFLYQELSEDEQKKQQVAWYINYSWMPSEEESTVTEYLEKKFDIDIEFVIPKGNESDKLQTMIDTETLPDLVTLGWWEQENQEMIDRDQVYALNQLADEYDEEFYKNINLDTADWYTQSDGNLYGYPSYSYTYEEYKTNPDVASNEVFLVRKDIYEAIGAPDMTTPEGFCNAVKKAAEMFPTVEGKDLIPIGADEFTNTGNNSFDLYLQNFLAIPYEKNGKYYDRNTDEEYIRWLKAFRKLGEEGLLKSDIFVDKRSQLEEKFIDGRYFCLLYQRSDIEHQQNIIEERNPEQIYIAIDGPKNSQMDNPVLPLAGINGWTQTYISKNCEYPEKVIQLVSFLLSEEGQKLVSDEGGNEYWMLLDQFQESKVTVSMKQMENWAKPYSYYLGQYELNFGEDMEMASIYEEQQSVWSDTLPELLLAESEEEFDWILNTYKEKRMENRYEEFEEAASELFKSNKARMGIE